MGGGGEGGEGKEEGERENLWLVLVVFCDTGALIKST